MNLEISKEERELLLSVLSTVEGEVIGLDHWNAIRPKLEAMDAKLRNLKPSGMAVGDLICKPKGYTFYGEVRSVFTNKAGETRIVAELLSSNGGGMLHIFSPSQLTHAELPGPTE